MNLPIIVLGDEGGFRGKQLPELMEIVKGANFVPRHTPSAWREPKFVEAVKKTGRTKLIVAGITTDNCVSLLTLDALRANYDVHVVLDAGGSDNALAEAAAVNRLSHAGAVMTSWVQLASELMVDWEKPEGTAIGKIYAEHIGGPKTAPGAALQRPGAQ
jgi:nicotinamidase-related amidase